MIELGLFLGRNLSPPAGYAIAHRTADLVAATRPGVYRTVWRNARHVLGAAAPQTAVDDLTHQIFVHAGTSYYDFFHALGAPPERLKAMMRVPETAVEVVREMSGNGRGVLLVGMHLSNFDLGALALGLHGLPIQVLSLADPPPGFRLLNDLRRDAGFEITPITTRSLRSAIERLRGGGIVMLFADWPSPDENPHTPFFGYPAFLPHGPARLALMADAAVYFGACRRLAEQSYAIDVQGPLTICQTGHRQTDLQRLTVQFAALMEAEIRARPEQWMMFHPFWPGVAAR